MLNDPNRVKEIFLGATELTDEAARAAYLDRACGDDVALRDRVEVLLRSHDTPDSFLGNPAVNPPELDNGATKDLGRAPNPGDANEADDLKFLDKPRRPDSLGRLGHYEVLQLLGRGGFGIVFRAFDDTLQRVVAIKVMAPQIATLSPARKRFVREARSSAAIRHENVVQVYEVGEQPLPYLTMEFIPGETLQQRLDRTGPLEVSEILRIGRQIAEGLAAAHACDLIHRDIKPGNILLEGGSHKAKITDFGLARAADDASISQSGVVAGTPLFMAPEQALGHHIDQRADLFSLGSVLYQMVSGRPPFRAPTALAVLKRVAEETPRPIPEIIPDTPAWLCGIITKLHAKNPNDRFQSAREVADLLADCEAKLKAKQEVKNVLPVVVTPARRKWVAAAAIVLVPLIALAVTELAGVTHLFKGPQLPSDPIKSDHEPMPPIQVAKLDTPPLAVAPFDAAKAKEHQEAWAKHLGVDVEITNSIGMKLRLIPPGQFLMGSPEDEVGREAQEGPEHEVVITQPFRMGIHDVTVGQFKAFVKEKGYKTQAEKNGGAWRPYLDGFWKQDPQVNWQAPNFEQTDDHPVVCVSWNDAKAFCDWLSEKEGKKYGMPTEAQWEFACRAGSNTKFYFGDDDDQLGEYGWYSANSKGKPNPVGQKKPNAWGLYDLVGNVSQWTADWRRSDYYWKSPKEDPPGPRAGGTRVVRGSNWWDGARFARAAFRHGSDFWLPWKGCTGTGFRVVQVGDLKGKTPAIDVAKEPLPPTFKNSLGMEFVLVPKGKSWLGGGKDALGDNEVVIPADFYLGKYMVTQEEWEKVMGENPSNWSRTGAGKDAVKDIPDSDLKRFPVEMVSWGNCQLFVEKLNRLEKETGWVYRLPKEVEWEYACRGGPMSDKLDSAFDFYFAKPTNTLLPEQANFEHGNGLKRTCKVGSYEPNILGLFDMHGNVWAWCDDTLKASDGASYRIVRGGSWFHDSGYCRAAYRFGRPSSFRSHGLGLRLVRVPSGAPAPEAKTPPKDSDRRAPE